VSTSTGFHANQAGWLLGEKGQYLLASQSFLNNDFAALINTVYLEHVFGQIDTNCCNLHLGRLSLISGNSHSPLRQLNVG
jgi:hypothetical protein